MNQSGYNGYAEESNGYEAVVQYTWGQWKPSLAYNRLDVKGETFDDTLTEYVSIGAWYNINDNFDVYVDYKANLLSSDGTDGYNKFGQNTDDVVGVAMQYHF
ncbi:Outer membrane pore protein E precursor [compost metagenome]